MTSLRTQLEELVGKADEHSAVLDTISDFIDDMPHIQDDMPHIQKDVKAVAAFLEEFTALAPTILAALDAVEWRSMDSAPRDGSYIVAIVAPNQGLLKYQAGRQFAIRHEGVIDDFDLGWAVYPGFGGASDLNFSHWRPLGPTPEGE